MEIKEKIKAIREALHLKKNEFAREIRISPGYMSDIESGKKEPSDSLLDLVMAKWNVAEEWWETGEGPIFKEEEKEDDFLKAVLNESRRLYEVYAAGGAPVDKSKAATVILEKLAELGKD